MSSENATALVVGLLEECRVDYILVGSLSSNFYGIARSTRDADIVVALDSIGVVEFAERLGAEFRLDRQMQMELQTGSVRNILTYLPTGFDIELFRLNDDPHHQQRFRRRKREWISELEREAWLPTAEDVVIQKLRWARAKDIDDVQNVIGVSGKRLDWDYINSWTDKHGTQALLNQILDSLPDWNESGEENVE